MAFPPYSYVPGHWPHPTRDPDGHSPGATKDSSGGFGRGIELFNHGYYWEAHEVWEEMWIQAGRRGTAADFLRGLIKLAASGVKLRQGLTHAAVDQARAARRLFQAMGNDAGEDYCTRAIEIADTALGDPTLPVQIVFPFSLSFPRAQRLLDTPSDQCHDPKEPA